MRAKDLMVQWLWFAFNVKKERIGYDKGLLTRLRVAGHRKLRRKIHICLLDLYPKGGKFGRFTSFWINERSRLCSASVNEGIEDADIVWIYSQDPLPPDIRKECLLEIKRAAAGTPVINHPGAYNTYHEEHTFRLLERAGVSVPRSEFREEDIGKTPAVYKVNGKHGSSKFLSFYSGELEGYRAFEFVDSRRAEGLYRKYRAFYIAGIISPNHVAFSEHWNVHRETRKSTEYIFDMTQLEIDSVRLISRVLNIQYFAVDFIRRSSDDQPVFTDINVYPLPIDFTETARQFGYYGRWIILDSRLRLRIPEPSGRPFWDAFDEAMSAFAEGRSANQAD